MDGHSLVVTFPDQSESFTYGLEAGMIFQRLDGFVSVGTFEAPVTVREENIKLYQDIADYKGYTVEIYPTNVDGWMSAVFTPIENPTPKPHLVRVK